MLYRVVWENRDSRNGGMGEPISEAAAKAWVEHANREHPEIHHWAEPVADGAEPSVAGN